MIEYTEEEIKQKLQYYEQQLKAGFTPAVWVHETDIDSVVDNASEKIKQKYVKLFQDEVKTILNEIGANLWDFDQFKFCLEQYFEDEE